MASKAMNFDLFNLKPGDTMTVYPMSGWSSPRTGDEAPVRRGEYLSFALPWGAILACIAGILAIVFATMMVSAAMIRDDNLVHTIKAENL